MQTTIDHNLSVLDSPVLSEARPIEVATRPNTVRHRVFDLGVSVPAALLTLPVTGALVAWSAISHRTAPLFTQPRLGQGGATFKFWKVRTLPKYAPDTADKYQLEALRLSRVTQVVRYRHLDEFPQLFLVIAGRMSLVGPRPEMPTLSASFDPEFVAKRLAVRPGCTGLWQVSVDSQGLIGEATEWDLHYVENRTLRLDLWICYRTIQMIASSRFVKSLNDIPRWTGAAVTR